MNATMQRADEWSPPMFMYAALIAACVATAGSLYMSETLGWIPCIWCWYQRIAMYPLAVLLTVGIMRRDRNVAKYALWLAVPGALAAVWHILIQKVPRIALLYPCRSSSPCSSDSLWSLGIFPDGFTVPMLALIAFVTIVVVCVAVLLRKPELDRAETEGFSPRLLAPVVVAPIVLMFGIAAFINAPSAVPNPLDVTQSEGSRLFTQSCAGCHAPQGFGHVNIRSSWLAGKSDADIVAAIKKGRTATDPENFSKQAMPPYGGQPLLTEEQLIQLAQHLRQ
jgi:disulfide bond formation protein DsbB/mono/diheme cytochrome c family protein